MNQTAGRTYLHLGPFSGLVAAARRQRPLFGVAAPGLQTRQKAREVLNFSIGREAPEEPSIDRRWSAGGVAGETVSWSVGFGPRTEAIFLKPEGAAGPLPGVVALHDHGHYKFFGKEKIADGPDGPSPELTVFRSTYYEGRAFANALARQGFAVLIHDAFLWGSRRFPLEVMPEIDQALAEDTGSLLAQDPADPAVVRYNGAAYHHEHLISKYCTLLGTSFAGVVAYEDRVALNYLKRRPDVDGGRIGCIGLSGGGSRAALLRATSEDLAVAVIAGMMCTYEELLDRCIAPHTWMFFPNGWSSHGDWPDLAASGAPAPLLVQYLLDDPLFTVKGMRDADAKMAAAYANLGAQEAYTGAFYPGPHRFDIAMQEQAFAWLAQHLGAGRKGAA
ncbi:MAG: dienelactone hydrolase family protein [Aestuariivirga sp.]